MHYERFALVADDEPSIAVQRCLRATAFPPGTRVRVSARTAQYSHLLAAMVAGETGTVLAWTHDVGDLGFTVLVELDRPGGGQPFASLQQLLVEPYGYPARADEPRYMIMRPWCLERLDEDDNAALR